MAISAELFLIFRNLDARRISEEFLTWVVQSVLKMVDDDNEQMAVAEDNGVEADLVDLMMDGDGFDAIKEKMVSLSLVRDYSESTGDKDIRPFSLHPSWHAVADLEQFNLKKGWSRNKLFAC